MRAQSLEALEHVDLDGTDPLTRDGYVFEMILQHEYQHGETMLATLQLMDPPGYRPELPPGRTGSVSTDDMVLVEAGPFIMGTDDRQRAYDNERAAHNVWLDAFWIDAGPVTNAAYMRFVEDTGYGRRELWSARGWDWLRSTGAASPQFWEERGETRLVNVFGLELPLNPREPVQHVCFCEAEAFARWAGKRLPTEAEWEEGSVLGS